MAKGCNRTNKKSSPRTKKSFQRSVPKERKIETNEPLGKGHHAHYIGNVAASALITMKLTRRIFGGGGKGAGVPAEIAVGRQSAKPTTTKATLYQAQAAGTRTPERIPPSEESNSKEKESKRKVENPRNLAAQEDKQRSRSSSGVKLVGMGQKSPRRSRQATEGRQPSNVIEDPKFVRFRENYSNRSVHSSESDEELYDLEGDNECNVWESTKLMFYFPISLCVSSKSRQSCASHTAHSMIADVDEAAHFFKETLSSETFGALVNIAVQDSEEPVAIAETTTNKSATKKTPSSFSGQSTRKQRPPSCRRELSLPTNVGRQMSKKNRPPSCRLEVSLP